MLLSSFERLIVVSTVSGLCSLGITIPTILLLVVKYIPYPGAIPVSALVGIVLCFVCILLGTSLLKEWISDGK